MRAGLWRGGRAGLLLHTFIFNLCEEATSAGKVRQVVSEFIDTPCYMIFSPHDDIAQWLYVMTD